MPLTKQIIIDQITVTENGVVLYREATRIMENDIKISETYHRSSLTPGQDLSGVPEQVAAHCATAWTPDVISAYEAQLLAQSTPSE